jgi:hypothetical protein
VLDASTRVAAAARSGLIDLRFAFVVDHAHRWVHGSQAASTYACCEEADLASLGWISFAEKRCTDAALVLDASTRVAAAKRSSLIDLHLLHPSSTLQMWVADRINVLTFGVLQGS